MLFVFLLPLMLVNKDYHNRITAFSLCRAFYYCTHYIIFLHVYIILFCYFPFVSIILYKLTHPFHVACIVSAKHNKNESCIRGLQSNLPSDELVGFPVAATRNPQ